MTVTSFKNLCFNFFRDFLRAKPSVEVVTTPTISNCWAREKKRGLGKGVGKKNSHSFSDQRGLNRLPLLITILVPKIPAYCGGRYDIRPAQAFLLLFSPSYCSPVTWNPHRRQCRGGSFPSMGLLREKEVWRLGEENREKVRGLLLTTI